MEDIGVYYQQIIKDVLISWKKRLAQSRRKWNLIKPDNWWRNVIWKNKLFVTVTTEAKSMAINTNIFIQKLQIKAVLIFVTLLLLQIKYIYMEDIVLNAYVNINVLSFYSFLLSFSHIRIWHVKRYDMYKDIRPKRH